MTICVRIDYEICRRSYRKSESLHMKEGDRMTFTLLRDGTVLIRVTNKSAIEIAGQLQKQGRL